MQNNGESLILGWEVTATSASDDFSGVTTWNINLDDGDWTISERTPVETNWYSSTPMSMAITVPDTLLVQFGNYCTQPGGGLTIGYWSNKNGQARITSANLAALRNLNLKNANGSDFDPTTAAQVNKFVLSASATNMANMLSAQLVAMTLNVAHGVDGNAHVLAYDGTVNALLASADAALAANAVTVAASPARTNQERLKNYLDYLNNNGAVVPTQPCAFSFAS